MLILVGYGAQSGTAAIADGVQRLQWLTPDSVTRDLTLRGTSLVRREYYRADAKVPAGPPVFDWAVDVREALQLSPRSDVGVLGWTPQGPGGARLYVPLTATAPDRTNCEITLWSTRELTEVYVRLVASGSGAGEPSAEPPKPLDQGAYLASRPIRYSFTVPTPGTYRLEASGDALNGQPVRLAETYLYVPGPDCRGRP